jgi:hypothetical protein
MHKQTSTERVRHLRRACYAKKKYILLKTHEIAQ